MFIFSAQDFAANSNQKTLSAAHIIQAIEAIGFGAEFVPQLNEALESKKLSRKVKINLFCLLDLKKQALLAKESKAASNITTATTQANEVKL